MFGTPSPSTSWPTRGLWRMLMLPTRWRSRRRARPPIYKGMNTKQPVDQPPEPDLQEHRRLINRALLRTLARQHARPVPDTSAPIWPSVLVGVAAGALLIVAGSLLAWSFLQ